MRYGNTKESRRQASRPILLHFREFFTGLLLLSCSLGAAYSQDEPAELPPPDLPPAIEAGVRPAEPLAPPPEPASATAQPLAPLPDNSLAPLAPAKPAGKAGPDAKKSQDKSDSDADLQAIRPKSARSTADLDTSTDEPPAVKKPVAIRKIQENRADDAPPSATAAKAPRDEAVVRTKDDPPPISIGTPDSGSSSAPPPIGSGSIGSSTSGGSGSGSSGSGSSPESAELSQYRPGVQGVGIYVEAISPPSANLQQETTFRVIVKNAMKTQAYGVVVKDILPDTLEYVKSQPEAKRDGNTLVWELGEMPIGSDKTLTIIAKPIRVGTIEHTATVSCQTGTRSRLVVQEPKIRVEQTLVPAKPLKGQPVQLRVAVSNPGTGVARNVAVVVKVSQGLQDGQGSRVFDQEIRRLGPGERMELQPLTLSTVSGGNQTSEVSATSPDVATQQADSKASQQIEVLEPKLKVTMTGPSQKYTNTEDIYEINVENPGTAPARNLQVSVFVPDARGVLKASRISGSEADVEYASRRLKWPTIDRINPGESKVLRFEYKVGAMGTYPFTADIRGESGLADKQSVTTLVTGVADVDFQISEKSRIIDVGDTTDYVINIRNNGTKDAENLLISAELSENLKAIETDGHEGNVQFDPKDPRQTTFPKIDHLPAGQEMTLVIRVEAVKPGLSRMRVFLHHEDLGEERLEKQIVTPRVTDKTQITSNNAKKPG
jgi:uncharacterized repeat protein (TIGR01451 family)